MQCKCTYFKSVNGELVCSVCGKPAHTSAVTSAIEDKMSPPPENKSPAAVKAKPAQKRK